MARGRNNRIQANADSIAVDTKTILSDLSKMADTDKVSVVSEKRAGKTIVGIGEKPVEFDANGKAEVTVAEAKYFLTIPGFNLEGETKVDTDKNSDNENGSDETTETNVSDAGNE